MRTTTAFATSPVLLHRGVGRALLDMHGDNIADVSVRRLLAHALNESGLAGAGVIGDFENGSRWIMAGLL